MEAEAEVKTEGMVVSNMDKKEVGGKEGMEGSTIANNEDGGKGANNEDGGKEDHGDGEAANEDVPEEKSQAPKRGDEDFTSEIYKIFVENMPKFLGVGQIKKMLAKSKLKAVKIKKSPEWTYAYLTFENEEEKERARSVLDGMVFKKHTFRVVNAAALPDPSTNKRNKRDGGEQGGNRTKKRRFDDDGNEVEEKGSMEPWERLNDQIVKLWRLPYDEQIETKKETCLGHMKTLRDSLVQYKLPWMDDVGECEPACPVEHVAPSPLVEGYRNKCEFTVGNNGEVGNLLGLYRDGVVGVVPPTKCPHVTQQMKDIAMAVQTYIQASPLKPFDRVEKDGYWRLLTVRTTADGKAMAILQMHPQGLSADEIAKVKEETKAHFIDKKELGITCMFFQVYAGKTNGFFEKDPVDLLFGDEVLVETLLGLKFRISPTSFFQINAPAAEVLYSTVRDWCSLTDDSANQPVVFDVCCGTGTIGMVLSKGAKEVIGVEIVASAIEDAKKNAALNDIQNCRFELGPAEKILPREVSKVGSNSVVAVVDPPRNGLQPAVIKAIRNTPGLKRLVYVSCEPKLAMGNFTDLCRPSTNAMPGNPFRPVKAMGVDLFPHTERIELVILFERD